MKDVTFRESTATFESRLGRCLKIVPADLKKKHTLMRAAIFPFFRATFYRWAQLWPEVCPEFSEAPELLAAGDLHVENFGTWRDIEGRLIWGINDFDEVSRMPYAVDLVRLAASAHLAIDADKLRIAHADACTSILQGYRDGMEAGGRPWVLAGRHPWLREMVGASLGDPARFWKKLCELATVRGKLPAGARRGLAKTMPDSLAKYRVVHRIAGMGSLGRQRFAALGESDGDFVCREAKALAPSAWDWARGNEAGKIRYEKALRVAVRAPDPFLRIQNAWAVRRLAPDCSRIDLAMFPRQRDEGKLLHAMGWEVANLHVGSGRKREVLADLSGRPVNWLHESARKMVKAIRADWKAFRRKTGTRAKD